MNSDEASQKRTNEPVSRTLEKILNQVREKPTHLNYWNAYKRIQKLDLESLNIPDEKRIKVALLSSFTIDPLRTYLDIKIRLSQLHPEIYIALFNQYQQEIFDENSRLYALKPDVIILAIQADVLLNKNFISEFVKLSDVEKYQTEILNRFQAILSKLTSKQTLLCW